MATDLEYLEIAENSYENDKISTFIAQKNFSKVNNTRVWKVLGQQSINEGFFGRAYLNEDTKEVIFAFRGSNSKFLDPEGDWINENIDTGWSTPQTRAARSFVKSIVEENMDLDSDYTYNFTGHSLGGKLAQQTLISALEGDIKEGGKSVISANQLGKAVVFNSAGTWNNDDARPSLSRKLSDYNVKHYSTSGDVLNGIAQGLGTYFGTHTILPFSYVKEELKKDTFKPLFIHGSFNSMKHYMSKAGMFSANEVYGNENGSNEVLSGRNTSDTIIGYDGNDTIYGYIGEDNIQGNDGNDILYGGIGSDILSGAKGDDILLGEDGNDSLDGGTGSDTLKGGAGNDVLEGGQGKNDRLEGGTGNDTYIFHKGDGIDTIVEIGDNFHDTLKIYGYTMKEAKFKFFIEYPGTYGAYSINVMIYFPNQHGSAYDKITVQGWERTSGVTGQVERLVFVNGGIPIEYDLKTIASKVIKKPFRNTILSGSQAAAMDPLILDLNGDGISSLSLEEGTHFDYDGDGFAEKTGWVNSEDGFLVRDLNQDGQINNGSELFGERTKLKNGKFARNGFEALSDLDNNQDGRIDQKDESFSQLKVWKDSDSDGIVGENELYTLDQLGITGLNLDYSDNIDEAEVKGNRELRSASYELLGSPQQKMSEFSFELDNTDTLPVSLLKESEGIEALPDIEGRGYVHSLHQAMQRDTTLQLQTWLKEFINTNSVVSRQELLQKIIYKWTGVDGIDAASRGVGIQAQKLTALERFYGINSKTYLPTVESTQIIEESYKEIEEYIYAQLMAKSHLSDLYRKIDFSWSEQTSELQGDLQMITDDLEARLLNNYQQAKVVLGEFIRTAKNLYISDSIMLESMVSYFAGKSTEIAWIVESNFRTKLVGTDQNDNLLGTSKDEALSGGTGNDILDGKQGNNALFGGLGNDTYMINRGDSLNTIYEDDTTSGNLDRLQFADTVSPNQVNLSMMNDDLLIQIEGEKGITRIKNYFQDKKYVVENIIFSDGTFWDQEYIARIVQNNIIGTNHADTLQGTSKSDFINALDGDDTLSGAEGHDTLVGGAGIDDLSGGTGNDLLFGSEGNDLLRGDAGDDILDGGTGNDILNDEYGNDIFRFGRGYGNDIVTDNETVISQDIVEFNSDVSPDDIELINYSYSLILKIKGTNDQLTINNHFLKRYYGVEKIRFSDGTTWDYEYTLKNAKNSQAYSQNIITGTMNDETLVGGSGDDLIMASGGNDILDGGAGNDYLRGNDNYSIGRVEGHSGADTYIFGRGYGSDTIDDYDSTPGVIDTIKMLVNPDEIEVIADFTTLTLSIKGTEDRISIVSYFKMDVDNPNAQIERVIFKDGTTWYKNDIERYVINRGTGNGETLYGTILNDNIFGLAGHDNLIGQFGNDKIYGDAGNDNLYGGAGNDVLDGGSGDDMLYGNRSSDGSSSINYSGSDTYVFGRGYGQDTIIDLDNTGAGVDTLRLLVDPDEIEVLQNANNLIVVIKDTGDQITIQQYFAKETGTVKDPYSQAIERVTFADGTVWNQTQLEEQVMTRGTNSSESLYGQEKVNNYMYGLLGNDEIRGSKNNDQLFGGGGNDNLYGGAGDDLLDGGSGNDMLYGNTLSNGYGSTSYSGSDTYVFGRGYGQDTIIDLDNTGAGVDTLRLLVDPDEIEVLQNANNLIVVIKDTGDQITVQQYFAKETGTVKDPYSQAIERVTFADGTVWNQTQL
ncbi:calcium-binding protein, partial [Paenibacillus sp. PsM32]|uniref:calcium-binding protein n=1 Tax=Paenibacillus sp. PsM32 TaxID=3030536 RepID=UPI00263B75A3